MWLPHCSTAAPVQFCLIDAEVSAHGAGGRRAPKQISTRTIIAASDAVLADYIGALKMGLDPAISPLFSRVNAAVPPHRVLGSLAPYPDWINVPEPSLRAARAAQPVRDARSAGEPWLQRLDTELFPLKHPLDARMNATLAEFFANNDWLLVLANTLIGLAGQSIESYRTLFDKDSLRRQAVPLGIDVANLADDVFDELVHELLALEPVADSCSGDVGRTGLAQCRKGRGVPLFASSADRFRYCSSARSTWRERSSS